VLYLCFRPTQTIKLMLNRSVVQCVLILIPWLVFSGGYALHIFERAYFISSSGNLLQPPIFGADLPFNQLPNMTGYTHSAFVSYPKSCWFSLVRPFACDLHVYFHLCNSILSFIAFVIYSDYDNHAWLRYPWLTASFCFPLVFILRNLISVVS
jgi:hypothetical protein